MHSSILIAARLSLALILAPAAWLAPASPISNTATTQSSSLAVTFRPKTDPARKVIGVEVEQRITRRGSPAPLSLVAPLRFAGMVPVAGAVMDLTITDQKGAVAAQTADWIMPDQNPGRRWTTARAVSGLVTVRYRMKVTPFEQGGPPFGVKAAGYGLGGNTGSLLMLPELPGLRQTTVRWDLSEMVKGSRGVMAGGLGTITIQGPSDSLLDRWLLAGPLTAGQSAYGHDFNAYTVGHPPFDARAMMTWAGQTYRVLSRSFGYLGVTQYLLLIRTLDAPCYATGTASVANGASLITVGSPTFLPDQSESGLRTTIAHEMTHNWVGYFDDSAAPWFVEGLTVYISATLPCETGLRPWSECAEEINRKAAEYYGSEARNWTQSRIDSAPFSRESVRRVPYGRGMMYFANLDHAIRTNSNGRRTLLTALRPLFEKRMKGEPITLVTWKAWLRAERGGHEVALFDRTVLGGEIVRPVSGAFGPHLAMVANTGPNVKDSGLRYAWHPTVGDAPHAAVH
ncbi:putative metalloprotease with PDZ domain [Sphingomonas sp. PP-CC-3G-468]|nr:putative metalloprotease with PDZ domain [Sphingomonas sp. PP-CC-1A-547]TCM05553.1 putative metalloprotease with PDZ domain [Sphingomonas sp. PP-CC-3G-468]